MKLKLLRHLFISVIAILTITTALDHLTHSPKFIMMIGLAHQDLLYVSVVLNFVEIALVFGAFTYFGAGLKQVVETLELGVKCFEDNDFSITIENRRDDELGRVVAAYNQVASTIRKERMSLYQREMLLDTIIQQTPVALMLVDANDVVVYSNDAACELFNLTQKADGERFTPLLKSLPQSLKDATMAKQSGLYSALMDQQRQVYYLSLQSFNLHSAEHHLYLYKNMSTEIDRQEVGLWKNAIRLMSHELNNSLGPISSLTNSAKDILAKPQHADMMPDILDTISSRCERLHQFIEQYAQYARLPSPNKQGVEVNEWIKSLNNLCQFTLLGDVPKRTVQMDVGQIEQVIINLVKNAHEANGEQSKPVNLAILADDVDNKLVFSVTDEGQGMSDAQLQQALLPFYSTKPQGTGVGLTLCNEIITAHGGVFRLANRIKEKGLEVRFSLPYG